MHLESKGIVPKAWCMVGSLIVCVTPDRVCVVLASEDKWTKAKALLEEVQDMLDADPTLMSRLRLEQIRGFLIYVTHTYPCMVPYLISFHMTIDSWRPDRKERMAGDSRHPS
jgi:hypothetical protein